jgi:hypothetical protein
MPNWLLGCDRVECEWLIRWGLDTLGTPHFPGSPISSSLIGLPYGWSLVLKYDVVDENGFDGTLHHKYPN